MVLDETPSDEIPADAPAGHGDPVHRDLVVDLDAEQVWDLLVDDAERAGWFGGPTELDPIPGGAGHFTDPDGTRRDAVVEEATPGRRLRWSWWPADDGATSDRTSRVDVELTPAIGGTRIAVTEVPVVPAATASVADARRGRPIAHRLLDLELAALSRSLLARA